MAKDALSFLIFILLLGLAPFCLRLNFLATVERAFARLAERRSMACAAVFCFSLLVSGGYARIAGVPPPAVHDEFSYLLAGDTYAHGRLTNPPHPLWKSFETFFVLQQPTYQSKYPPGQGMSLALGEKLTGLPIVGVWLTTALACAAMCWMLAAWISPRWGLAGGLLTALHPIVLQWSQSYWGGSFAFAGGALLFGGLRRVVDTRRLRDAVLMACGAAVLLATRPYEGGIMIAFALGRLAWTLLRGPNRATPPELGRVAVGIAAPLMLALIGLAYYNVRVTGSPLKMPYALYQNRYDPAPVFLVLPMRPMPQFDNAPMHDAMVQNNVPQYRSQTESTQAIIVSILKKTALLQRYSLLSFNIHYYTVPPFDPGLIGGALQYLLVVPLLALPLALGGDLWTRYAIWGCGLAMAGLFVETWIFPQYAAPSAPLLAVVLLQSLRSLRSLSWRGRPIGQAASRIVAILYLASFFVSASQFLQMRSDHAWAYQRASLVRRLHALGGRQLVLVRYEPGHVVDHEWVYNDADIDGSAIVWARELDPAQNARVLAYYPDRKAWLLDPDRDPKNLVPLSR